jgi:uncharacterized membrane protein
MADGASAVILFGEAPGSGFLKGVGMKRIVFSILVIAGLLAFVYTGRVQKAGAVTRVRLKARLATGEITRRQYDEAMVNVSFGSMFWDPKAVLAVD